MIKGKVDLKNFKALSKYKSYGKFLLKKTNPRFEIVK